MTEEDDNGGTFRWKFRVNTTQGDPEFESPLLICATALMAVISAVTVVFLILGLQGSAWHLITLGVFGSSPALGTLLFGLGALINRLRRSSHI